MEQPQLQLHVPGCPVSAAAALGDPAKSGFSGGGAGAGAGFEDVETPTLGSCGKYGYLRSRLTGSARGDSSLLGATSMSTFTV